MMSTVVSVSVPEKSPLRQRIATKVLDELRAKDPDFLRSLGDLGHSGRPVRMELVERALERVVERRPSFLAQLGLTAIQVLAAGEDDGADGGGTVATLTVGFTDLEGFTEYTSRQGDDAASKLLIEHHRVVGPLVRSRGGRIVKRLGDGLLLTFPEPAAGVMAALELVDAEPAPLRLRAGLHMGSVVQLKDDVIGHVVNVAARVAEAASGGEVLVTKSIVGAAEDDLPKARFGEPADTAFKGIDERLAVCRAEWRSA